MKPLSPRWLITVALTGLLLYLVWLMVQPLVTTLLWAVVLTILIQPVHKRLCRWGWSPTISALTTLALFVVLVAVPLFYIGKAVVAEMASAIGPVEEGLRNLMKPDSHFSRWLANYPQLQQRLNPDFIAEQMKAAAGAVASYSLGFVSNVIVALAQAGIVIFTTFYMLRDREALKDGVKRFLPMTQMQSEGIFVATLGVTSASLRGALIVAAVQGAIGGITFWLLGLTAPLLWGVLMCITALVPLFGSAIVWGPAAVYLLLAGSYGRALVLVAVGAGVIGVVDNLLRPMLVGSRTRMHDLVVFFAILGGIELFGALGIVIGPVIVALTVAMLLVFYQMGDDKPSADKAQELLQTVTTPDAGEEGAEVGEPAEAAMSGNPLDSLTGTAKVAVSPVADNDHVDEHAQRQAEGNHP